jgi:hypothetical protein
MLVQVTGATVAAVLIVLWLWIADVRRWWPFAAGVHIRELLEHRAGIEAVQMLTASAPEPACVSVVTLISTTTLAPADRPRCGAHRTSRAPVVRARVESGDAVHPRACARRAHASSGRPCGASRASRTMAEARPV